MYNSVRGPSLKVPLNALYVWFLPRLYYRPQRSWGKVMFLHVSVILSTGGCLLLGGSGPKGVPGGATATTAGGRHPTGMHSC